ncbi:MAG: hypothetical protein IRY99_24600 [Isosphaeraceae bacterium]|nr:hypothetical protein [Isosphaeraceae bacterium]
MANFLRTPDADRVYEEFEVPWLLSVIVTLIAFSCGLVCLPTIVGTRLGGRLILFAVRLQAFESRGRQLRQGLDQLHPLMAHGIIIGPQGHGLWGRSTKPSNRISRSSPGR